MDEFEVEESERQGIGKWKTKEELGSGLISKCIQLRRDNSVKVTACIGGGGE